MERSSGTLMPVASLPSRFGIGGFGKESYRFVDSLKEGGFRLWQILPLNPLGFGHSPYQPFSSFAIDEIYTDLDDLKRRGFIEEAPSFPWDYERIHYEEVRAFVGPILKKAYGRAKEKEGQNILSFIATRPWAKAWGLFMFYKRKNGFRSWNEWPAEEQGRILCLDALTEEEMEGVAYECWVQMNLYREWIALRAYANRKGIRIIGDVPFYVGYDSCDVWGNLGMFEIDSETKKPIWVAGVPPDYFSKDGQRWGNPIYRWETLEKNGFSFLLDRLKGSADLYDILRLDHFRAFDTYWRIPFASPTARDGSWVEAPGYRFFDAFLRSGIKTEIIAEDLGDLRPEVYALRDHYGFPGMNVLEFTFKAAEIDGVGDLSNPNMVAYVGTHDNQTFQSFLSSKSEGERTLWGRALAKRGFDGSKPAKGMIEYLLSLPSNYAILSMQDVLGLGEEARLNEPSTINDRNWTWRLKNLEAFKREAPFLKGLNDRFDR